MNSDRSSKSKAKGPAKQKNPSKSKKPAKQSKKDAPAARVTRIPRMLGLRDILDHEVPFVHGYVYVGNGTLGATDQVYFINNAQTQVVSTAPHHVPIRLGTDVVTAAPAYLTDVTKHFARYRVKKLSLELVSLQPSTANSMTVTVAPIRGAGDTDSVKSVTGTAAGATLQNTIAQAGARNCASWESMKMDITGSIAGGSGSKQNEFNTDMRSDANLGGAVELQQTPAAYVISGSNSTAALRGTFTHMIIVRPLLDLLDFIAGNVNDTTYALSAVDMVLKPSHELLATLEYIGGSALLKLLETRRNALLENPGLREKGPSWAPKQ